mmetsp:Transcript_38326/g.49551  ORF Transcript_38326/g.49551 Transcript_38326/m.49551 type:complete len:392 (+) Transcript_38326:137-1312(+)
MGATSSINRPQNLFKFKKESRKETQKQSKSTLATTSQVFTTVLIATPILQNSRKTFRKHLMKKGILPAAHTFKIHQFAMKVEPRITELLSDLAQQYGGKLVGLEYKFKTLISLQGKVDRDLYEANLNLLNDMGEKRENFAKLQTSASNTIESNLYLFGNTNQNQKNQSDNKEGLKKKRQSIIKSIAKVMKTESINDMKAPIEEEGTPSFINRFEESNSSSSNGNGNAINNIKTPVGEDEITPSFINRFESTAQLSEIKLFTYERSLSASFDQESKEAEINENKIKQDALEDKDDIVDIGKIVWSISDALRYTVLLDVNTYTEGVKKIMERLNEEGMFIVSKKNFWPRGDGYQGINNVFGLKCEDSINGVFKFEVQFHTQDSFDFKMSSHGL